MRSAVLRGGALVVCDDVPNPLPGEGQVLVQVRACGVCGSDLHFARHGGTMLALGSQPAGLPGLGDPSDTWYRTDLARDVFMGRELAAEALEAGPDTVAPTPGTIVTSIPQCWRRPGSETLRTGTTCLAAPASACSCRHPCS